MMIFIIALPCEAKPIIKHFELQALPGQNLFPIYSNNKHALAISGVGKLRAAAAVAYMYKTFANCVDCGWLNIGVAGHAKKSVGKAVLANKITDGANDYSWYPPQIIKHDLYTDQLITVDVPEQEYPCTAMYDMEAAGFYNIATSCSSLELIQCIKVISDNLISPADKLSKQKVEELISNQVDVLEHISSQIMVWVEQSKQNNKIPVELEEFLKKWHFSVTQQLQLEKLLKRHQVLNSGCELLTDSIASLPNSKAVIYELDKIVSRLPVTISK